MGANEAINSEEFLTIVVDLVHNFSLQCSMALFIYIFIIQEYTSKKQSKSNGYKWN